MGKSKAKELSKVPVIRMMRGEERGEELTWLFSAGRVRSEVERRWKGGGTYW